MAIEALLERPITDNPVLNVADDIGANVEVLRLSGLVTDINHEATEEQVTADFTHLGGLGIAGELFIAIPHRQLPLSHRIATLDSLNKNKHGYDHPETYVYSSLWTPGTQAGSYTEEQLSLLGPGYDGKKWTAHGRLVVSNTENPQEPILWHLGKPFDGKHVRDGEETQLEALAKQKAAFEAGLPEANLNPLTARDVAYLAVLRLVKGEPMPMEWGFMRDATLPRTSVDGGSLVGGVRSDDTRLKLSWANGYARPSSGVGVSAGLNDLEPQAS